jgi:hypothetical protein
MWKRVWDIYIADSEFRKYYTDRPTYDLTVIDKVPIKSKAGSLYIPPKNSRDSEGHFIAFENTDKYIVVFDPSYYAYPQFSNNPVLHNVIKVRSNKQLKRVSHHPQDLITGDTFCQTWSIAWLDKTLRSLVNNATTKSKSIDAIYQSVYKISHSKKFIEYMIHNENTKTFVSVIGESQRKFKVPESTCRINSVREFIQFSQHISRDDIARIMLNKT